MYRAGSWLHTVARNLAISTYHRRRRARPREVPLEEWAVPAAGDEVDGRINAWLIGAALNSLSAEHRTVIVELYYRQRTIAEVAALLGIPVGTVRSRCMLPDPIRRDRPARVWRAAAVAAMAAAAAGVAAGFWLAPRSGRPARPTLTLSAANPATDVQATRGAHRNILGHQHSAPGPRAPLNQPCQLIVRSRAGAREVTGSWDAWHAGPVTVPASTSWRPSDITTLQVATKTRTLVTITAPRSPHPRPAPGQQSGETP